MVKNAERHAQEDKLKKELVEAVNHAEGIIHDVEAKVEEYQSQLPPEEVTKIKELIAKTQEVLGKKDTTTLEEIKTSTNNLQQASLKLFELAYRKVSRL